MCCKDYGHLAENCPKDPNLRTGLDDDEEMDRVEIGLDENKKYQSDSQQLTLKMLAEFVKFKD
jgi:hypothetical protein